MSLPDTIQDDKTSARARLRPVVIAVLVAKLAAAAILIANVNMPTHASATADSAQAD